MNSTPCESVSTREAEPPRCDVSRTVLSRVDALVDQIRDRLVADRRDFHHYAETGWLEFRTASRIARRLAELGFDVAVGRDVIDADSRMGLPEPETLNAAWVRASEQGGDPEYLKAVQGGFTGVVGTLACGHGPTVAVRHDIDALDLEESSAPTHRPMREGFRSVYPGAAHACGHDGHAAIGLGLAEVLVGLRDCLSGTVKLIFQPAEEGVRGAKAMVAAGVVEGVDALLGLHLYSGWPTGRVVPGKGGFLATSKFDAYFTGAPAHAGGAPQLGRNAMLAAATAVLNLHAIPRHADGVTRINVGRLIAGQGRNVIAPTAYLAIETRGATSELNDYMVEASHRVLRASAAMYDCELDIRPMGEARSAVSDADLAERIGRLATELAGCDLHTSGSGSGSEDFTFMMHRVQQQGGLATSIGFGADLGGYGHHTAGFDFDEAALPLAVRLLALAIADLHHRSR